jgi:cobyrinic acid a,c-diamide synthase
MTLAPTASAPVAPAAMARALKAPVISLIYNIERNETISGARAAISSKDPQVLISFILLAEIEPKQKAALFQWLQL